MLRPLKASEFDKYIDFAYELALDLTKSGYPTYTDGIKTKADFVQRQKKAMARDNEEILLFEYQGEIEGWLKFLYLADDHYISLDVCCVRQGTAVALSEWLHVVENRFHGYQLYLGFPKENVEAIQWLHQNNFQCIDESFNDVLFFENYQLLPEQKQTIPVTQANFSDFRKLHALYETDMYWNSERLYHALDKWQIYLCYEQEEAVGAIYWIDEELTYEIFGIDFKEGIFCEEVFVVLLIKALNHCKQKKDPSSMIFFTDDQMHPIVLKMGFQTVSQYVCYMKEL